MSIVSDVSGLVGKTPIVKIGSFSASSGANILGKCEFLNPGSSIKDRIALQMINDALANGTINQDSLVIEPTSGNTGIGLAMICATKNIKLALVMPESMSLERRSLFKAFGATLHLSPASLGMKGAVEMAQDLANKTPNSVILQQFENASNPKAHRLTTALEILEDTNGELDIFVSAIGTGGSISGVGEVLKQKIPNLKIIAVEPSNSPVLSGGKPSGHKIQGIGAGFVPGTLNTKIYDEIFTVDDTDAINTARDLAKKDGLLVGISSGANVFAATQIAKKYKAKNVLTFLCDTGERYISSGLYKD